MFNLNLNFYFLLLTGHRETITCLCLSDSGKWLVTGSEDTNVNVWLIDCCGVVTCKLKHRLRLRHKFNLKNN